MSGADLREQAESFAERLTTLLNGTVTTGARVTVFMHEGSEHATVSPGATKKLSDIRPVPCSTARTFDERRKTPLWLKVFYTVKLDPEGEHMAVETSMFGLCINPKTGFCPIRVEYDREKTNAPAAHVQVHGESGGLGYAYALAGRLPKDLSKIHFPAGSRRFRPSLEDFIEFLAQERLLPDIKAGWHDAVTEGRGDWEDRQTKAAVRRSPAMAAEQLRAMGYTVQPP